MLHMQSALDYSCLRASKDGDLFWVFVETTPSLNSSVLPPSNTTRIYNIMSRFLFVFTDVQE